MSKFKLMRIKKQLDRILSKHYFIQTMKEYLPSDTTRQITNNYVLKKSKDIAKRCYTEGVSSDFNPIEILYNIIKESKNGIKEINKIISPIPEEKIKETKEEIKWNAQIRSVVMFGYQEWKCQSNAQSVKDT